MRSIQLSYGRVLFSPTSARCVREANKPSSVSGEPEADHFSGTAVTRSLKQPTRDSDGAGRASPLFGLAPGGVCHAAPVASRAVVSYTTVSPLPVPSRVIGGLFSVALSVASRRPAVSRHPALRSSDFPQHPCLPVRQTECCDPHSLPDLSINNLPRPRTPAQTLPLSGSEPTGGH
jgi:hypothetical protein